MEHHNPTLFELSADTVALEAVLRDKANTFDVISYAELSDIIGRDVRTTARGNLNTARKHLQDDGICYGTVRGVGLVRLDDAGVVKAGQNSLVRVRNQARRGLKVLACVADWDDLSNEDRIRHNTLASNLGALYQISSPNSLKKLSARLENAEKQTRLPLAKTLEVFRD